MRRFWLHALSSLQQLADRLVISDPPPRVRMVVVSIEPTNPGAQREANEIWTGIQGSRSSQVVATEEFGGGRRGA